MTSQKYPDGHDREDYRLTFMLPADLAELEAMSAEARGSAHALTATGARAVAFFFVTIAAIADSRVHPESYPSPVPDPVQLIVGGHEKAPDGEIALVVAVLQALSSDPRSPAIESWRRVLAGMQAGQA